MLQFYFSNNNKIDTYIIYISLDNKYNYLYITPNDIKYNLHYFIILYFLI